MKSHPETEVQGNLEMLRFCLSSSAVQKDIPVLKVQAEYQALMDAADNPVCAGKAPTPVETFSQLCFVKR